MSYSPFPGPVAPYNNPPINPEYYEPSKFEISAISLGQTTTVTTSTAHDYVIGQVVRLLIPFYYGSRELDGQQGYVISIPSTTQVVVTINSVGATAFIPSPSYGPTPPQIIAVGDVNTGAINDDGPSEITTYIPGSFRDVSPN